jgi:hypothetical protein
VLFCVLLYLSLMCCAQTATDYGGYLANEASPLYTSTIVDRCTQKLVEDWNAMRCQVRVFVCVDTVFAWAYRHSIVTQPEDSQRVCWGRLEGGGASRGWHGVVGWALIRG